MMTVKQINIFFSSALLVSALLFFGCDPYSKPDVDKNQNMDNISTLDLNFTTEDFSSSVGKTFFLTAKLNFDVISLLKDAGIDFDAAEKASQSVNSEFGLVDLEPFIKDNLSKSRSGQDGDITFEEELELLLEEYKETINNLVPSFKEAQAKDLIEIEDDEILLYGENIPVYSIEGITIIEIMNMVANGIEIEDAVTIIQNDVDKLFVDDKVSSTARGLYINPGNSISRYGIVGSRWSGGVIRYEFVKESESWDSTSKNMVVKAMKTWENGTGKISFKEVNPSEWERKAGILGQYSWVEISLKNLPNSTPGKSTLGESSLPFGHLYLNPIYKGNEKEFLTICLHELGHTIGLKHEHQRPDRDKYVRVSRTGNEYDKIPDKALVAGLKKVKIWRITIYIPYIWYVDYGITVGNYDYNSIMGYTNEQGVTAKNGTIIERLKNPPTPTQTDFNTVKKMY
jgi:hypothetical protein